MKNTRVAGHNLMWEGAPHNDTGSRIGGLYGGVSGEGRGACSCGSLSAPLPSGAARRRWHNEHKHQVAPAADRARTTGGEGTL